MSSQRGHEREVLLEDYELSDSNSESEFEVDDERPWWKRPNPYIMMPIYAFYQLGQMVLMIVQPNAALNVACKSHYGYELKFDDPQCQLATIQKRVSRFAAFVALISGLIIIWVLPKLSRFSDRHGRRAAFGYFFAFDTMTIITYILVQLWWETFGFYSLVVPTLLQACAGSAMMISVTISSYVADCTTAKDRTKIMGFIAAINSSGTVVGPLIASLVTKHRASVLDPFFVPLACDVIAVVYMALMLPESLPAERMKSYRERQAQEPRMTLVQSVKDALNLTKPFKTVIRIIKSQEPAVKRNVMTLFVIQLCYICAAYLRHEPTFLYYQMKLEWTAVELGYLSSMAATSKVIQLVALAPLVLKILKTWYKEINAKGTTRAELLTVRAGLAMEAIGCLLFAAAQTTLFAYLAGLVESLGAISKPTLDAAFLNLIPPAQLGQFLGANGAVVTTAIILVIVVGMAVYSLTVDTVPILLFLVASFTYGTALMASLWVKPYIHPAEVSLGDDGASRDHNDDDAHV